MMQERSRVEVLLLSSLVMPLKLDSRVLFLKVFSHLSQNVFLQMRELREITDVSQMLEY